jgi:hypothetical protein
LTLHNILNLASFSAEKLAAKAEVSLKTASKWLEQAKKLLTSE